MLMEEALVARLVAVPGIAAVAGENVSLYGLPRKWRAALLITTVWPGRDWTHAGPVYPLNPRMQFDGYALDDEDLSALMGALQDEMERADDVTAGGWTFLPPGMLELSQQSTEDIKGVEGGAFRWTMDFSFFAQPAG